MESQQKQPDKQPEAKTKQLNPHSCAAVCAKLEQFNAFGTRSQVSRMNAGGQSGGSIPVFTNEFWTPKQRQAHPLHEISYRACFKPQLPRFFIQLLTSPSAQTVVYDPFSGRGTTALEAAMLGCTPWACDINPLSRLLSLPRLHPPTIDAVADRLEQIFSSAQAGRINAHLRKGLPEDFREDLLVFYHPSTLEEIGSLRAYLREREVAQATDDADRWIQMVATNRLTGHSSGFFSVYSMPPNQAVSIKSQQRINERRNQIPPQRDVAGIILKKSRTLLAKLSEEQRLILREASQSATLLTTSADATQTLLLEGSVDLVVTSPPFLNEVDYAGDNWLRCWFNRIDSESIPIWILRKPADWQQKMAGLFKELHRLLKPGGWIAFEVGEVRKGTIQLETLVIPAAQSAGLRVAAVLINEQEFTKTANCWGVQNNTKGTNSNRIIIAQKPL